MGENFLNNHWIFDAGDDIHRAAAFTAGFDVDAEYAFQALSPGHGCPLFGGRLVLPLIGCPGLIALAPPGRRHPRTVLTVRCEHAMETGQVDSGLRYQSGQGISLYFSVVPQAVIRPKFP